jgi:peptidoglycan DL-endopeptidase CwlO
MLCALVALPAYADPIGDVPDPGARPVPAGPVTFPGAGGTGTGSPPPPAATPVAGPFASQVMAEDVAVQTLGEQLKQLQIDMEAAEDTLQSTEEVWREVTRRVADLRLKVDSAAADAYKAAAGLGPLADHAGDIHKFSVLVPGLGTQAGGQAAARDLLRAEQEERAANNAFKLANSVAASSRSKFEALHETYLQRSANLANLKAQNAAEYAKIITQSDAYEQSLGGANLAANASLDGLQAHPLALQAATYALSKLGSPYVWGDEGPNTFDCSGLAYWAYGRVGQTLPRVANTMYHGTPAIAATRYSRGDLLLPGDLVFFATDPNDWRSIHHMGMYIGEGRMVHAPSTGDVVRISPVTWSRFFGATRIFAGVPGPTAPGAAPAGPGAAPAAPGAIPGPTGSGPTGVWPSATASTSPSTSASASPSAVPSSNPSPSPIPSPSPSTTSPSPSTTSPSPAQTSESPASSPMPPSAPPSS